MRPKNVANEFSATHIAPQALAWLKEFSHGRPLHIFPHACNLVNHQGQVLSLVTSHIGPNPLALVLPPLHFPDFITIDSPIHLTPYTLRHTPYATPTPLYAPRPTPLIPLPTLHIGRLTINLQTAGLWHPIPPWSNHLDLERIHNIVTNHPDFQPAVPLHLARQMQQALHNHDRSLIAQTARHLAGLGPGLTPAGDDFLVGVIYALFRNQYSVTRNPLTAHRSPLTDYRSLNTEYCLLNTEYCPLITAAATPHTTTLSANLLQAAARGEASQPWHDLIAAQTSDACYNALTRILHTGHSSGADALLGFITGTTTAH